jgi:ribosomal-protein-alanine N-acetyltransferase
VSGVPGFRATLEHAALLAELDALCFARAWNRAAWQRELETSHAWVAVAGTVAEPRGHVCLWHLGEEAQVQRIGVIPRWRRVGVAGDLLRWALDVAAAAGCTRFELEVGARNVAAQHVYAAAGFRVVGHRAGYYPAVGADPPDDALLMRRS